MEREHFCWWTRRKESELAADGMNVCGAGLPHPVLEGAARLLGSSLTASSSRTDEYGEDIALDTLASGATHDGCMFQLRPVSPQLKQALLESALAFHGKYLGLDVDWSEVLPALMKRFGPNTTLRLRSYRGDDA